RTGGRVQVLGAVDGLLGLHVVGLVGVGGTGAEGLVVVLRQLRAGGHLGRLLVARSWGRTWGRSGGGSGRSGGRGGGRLGRRFRGQFDSQGRHRSEQRRQQREPGGELRLSIAAQGSPPARVSGHRT